MSGNRIKSALPRSTQRDTYLLSANNSPGIPIITITTAAAQVKPKAKPLPPLPSHRYRYTIWHELKDNELRGDELHHPRVRVGPPVKEEVFYEVKDEQGNSIHHDFKGRSRDQYERKIGNWEQVTNVNLSYQDLAHEYQRENLRNLLGRLQSAESIHLVDNSIEDLRRITFPRCTVLNLSQNVFVSFKKLPTVPCVKHLNLCDNSIQTFDGLANLRSYSLQSLDLRRNPICFEDFYRQRIFQALPHLKVLDGIPKLPSDSERFQLKEEDGGGCVVS